METPCPFLQQTMATFILLAIQKTAQEKYGLHLSKTDVMRISEHLDTTVGGKITITIEQERHDEYHFVEISEGDQLEIEFIDKREGPTMLEKMLTVWNTSPDDMSQATKLRRMSLTYLP